MNCSDLRPLSSNSDAHTSLLGSNPITLKKKELLAFLDSMKMKPVDMEPREVVNGSLRQIWQ